MTLLSCKPTKTPWKSTIWTWSARIFWSQYTDMGGKKRCLFWWPLGAEMGEKWATMQWVPLPVTELSHSSAGVSHNFHSRVMETTRRRSLDQSATGRNDVTAGGRKQIHQSGGSVNCVLSCQWCCQRRYSPFIPLLLRSTWNLDTAAFHPFNWCQEI